MPSLPIVGARFRPPAEDVLRNLPSGADLILRRQPDNPYDANAVQVMLPDGDIANEMAALFEFEPPLHLGFIPRTEAASIGPQMDERQIEEIKGLLTFSPQGAPLVSFHWEESETVADQIQADRLDRNL